MIRPTCQDLQLRPEDLFLNRRQFLERAGMGFGALSLTGLVAGHPGNRQGGPAVPMRRPPVLLTDELLRGGPVFPGQLFRREDGRRPQRRALRASVVQPVKGNNLSRLQLTPSQPPWLHSLRPQRPGPGC